MLKIAVVGVGHLGKHHARKFAAMPDVLLAGIYDQDTQRCQELAQELEVKAFGNYQALLDACDGVDISATTTAHYDLAKTALLAGKHVFVEKPITAELGQARELVSLAAQQNLKLQVGHIERFNPVILAVEDEIANPMFIESHLLSTFHHRGTDVPVVLDLMIHDIDIVMGLCQSPVKDIQAVGVNVLTDKEDIANARITFTNGCVCNLTASRVSPEVMIKIRIFLNNTYISLDYVQQEAFIYKKHGKLISKHALPIEKEEPLKQELESFVDCVVNHKKPIFSGIEGRNALKVALEITEKIKKLRRK